MLWLSAELSAPGNWTALPQQTLIGSGSDPLFAQSLIWGPPQHRFALPTPLHKSLRTGNPFNGGLEVLIECSHGTQDVKTRTRRSGCGAHLGRWLTMVSKLVQMKGVVWNQNKFNRCWWYYPPINISNEICSLAPSPSHLQRRSSNRLTSVWRDDLCGWGLKCAQ